MGETSPLSSSNVALSLDANGGVFVAGNFQQTAAFGNLILNGAGGSDIFLAKIVQ